MDANTQTPRYHLHSSKEQITMLGEAAAISLIDPNDELDLELLRQIDKDEKVLSKMKGDPLEDSELFEFAHGFNDPNRAIFAIRGSQRVINTPSELGKLQGWVQFYPEEQDRLKRLIAKLEQEKQPTLLQQNVKRRLQQAADSGNILEISYAKRTDAANKQISSGVRLASLMLPSEMLRRRFLLINNYNPTPQLSYAEYLKSFFITGYVDADENLESVRVLNASGFIKIASLNYDQDSDGESDVYILDWPSLLNKVEQKAHNLLQTVSA